MKFWTKEQEARLRQLYAEGQTIQQCAVALGMSYPATQSKAIRMALTNRHVPSRHNDPEFLRLRAEGRTARQIAKEMGSTLKRVQNWIAEAIRQGLTERRQAAVAAVKWTPERVAELKRHWATGYGPTAIAEIMGETVDSVGGKARSLGLPKKGYPKVRKAAPPRDYRTEHLVSIARKPRPQVTSDTWLKTATSRPFLSRERNECAWPLGERGDYHACCAETLEGDAYCEHHRLMAGGLKITGVRMDRKDWKMAA